MSDNIRYTYKCAMTDHEQPGVGLLDPNEDDDGGLDDLPVGWTRIQIQRRQINPEWLALQQIKESIVNGILAQVPEAEREAQRGLAMVQVRAQFHALESSLPIYIVDVEDTVYVSDRKDALEPFNEIRDILGLPPVEPGLRLLQDEDEEG